MKIRTIFAIFGTAIVIFSASVIVGSFDKRELRRGISSNAKEISGLLARVTEVERSISRTIDSIYQIENATVAREVVYTVASFYAEEFAGLPTSSLEIFNPDEMTTAHPRFPFGTILIIENLRNGRATVVRVNDRGPFVDGRGIDISRAAAESIGMTIDGLAPVRITVFHLPREIER